VFLGVKKPPLSPSHLFPDLTVSNLGLYESLLKKYKFCVIILLKRGGHYMYKQHIIEISY
jgi:hypothetical protein